MDCPFCGQPTHLDIPTVDTTGAFQKSELAVRTMAGLVILKMKWAFSKSF